MKCPECDKDIPSSAIDEFYLNRFTEKLDKMEQENADIFDSENYESLRNIVLAFDELVRENHADQRTRETDEKRGGPDE